MFKNMFKVGLQTIVDVLRVNQVLNVLVNVSWDFGSVKHMA